MEEEPSPRESVWFLSKNQKREVKESSDRKLTTSFDLPNSV